MSKVIYTFIGDKYYKIDQNSDIPSSITKNIHNSVSYTEKNNLNELDLNVDLSTIDVQHTETNKEACDNMKEYLRKCTNIREIDVIPNRFKMRLTYAIYDDNGKVIDNSSTMRDVDPTDMLLALGVNEYNEALYRRIKVFNPRFKFLVRNIIPYGIMKPERKKYTIRIIDIALYQQKIMELESIHPSMYDTPYNVTSPTINDTLDDMLLIYSSKVEGIEFNPVTVGYIPRNVYVNIKLMKGGYISFYTESEIQEILSNNKDKPLVYQSCDVVLTVNNRVELNGESQPDEDEIFRYNLDCTDVESEKYLPDEKLINICGYGSANFGTMTFTAPGIYTYFIHQLTGTNDMYNYSEEVYKVLIEVSSYPDYTLDAKSTIYNSNGDVVESIRFTNYYGITPATYEFEVDNIIDDTILPEVSENFMFTISQIEDEIAGPIPDPNTIIINGAGMNKFSPVVFDKVGVWKYKITMIKGSTENCEYDDDIVNVTVITEKSENKLVATVLYVKNDEHYINAQFTSKYSYIPTNVTISGQSLVIGDTPVTNDTFYYKIKPVTENAKPLEIDTVGISSALNTFNFDSIQFVNPGFYVYSVYQTTEPNVSYTLDKNVFYVLITVSSKYDTLEYKVEYAMNDISNKVDLIVFSNKYTTPDSTTAIGNTTHVITSGDKRPNDDGLVQYYSYCRETHPNALTVVEDNTPVEEYDDATMVPKTCVINDLPDAVSGNTVLFNEGLFSIDY